jgi:hypothetical protein
MLKLSRSHQADPELRISYAFEVDNIPQFAFSSLADGSVPDPVRKFISNAKSSFPFSMEIPDPYPSSNMSVSATMAAATQQQTQSTRQLVSKRPCFLIYHKLPYVYKKCSVFFVLGNGTEVQSRWYNLLLSLREWG